MKPLRGMVSRGSEEVPSRGNLSMEKIKLMLFVLALTAMTIGSASAFEQSPENPARGMIEHDDRDGDGKVSKDEFPGPDEHFTVIDLDGDGSISREEARHAPRPRGRSSRVPGKFQEDDADGDGVVSRAEFSGPADHFDRLDLDGDGTIQESEARQGPPIRVQQNR